MNLAELEKLISIWESREPKCPCGKSHERKRVGKSLTWEVKHACAYRGPISISTYGKLDNAKKEETKQ